MFFCGCLDSNLFNRESLKEKDKNYSRLLGNIFLLSIKWNRVEMATQIFDELIILDDLRILYYYIEEVIKSNRWSIFQIFCNEFPDIIEKYLTPKLLYFLYNFKNKVNIFK